MLTRKKEREKIRDGEIEKSRNLKNKLLSIISSLLKDKRPQKDEECPYCFKIIPDNETFCPNCGSPRHKIIGTYRP